MPWSSGSRKTSLSFFALTQAVLPNLFNASLEFAGRACQAECQEAPVTAALTANIEELGPCVAFHIVCVVCLGLFGAATVIHGRHKR